MAGGGFNLLAASALAIGFLFPSTPLFAADSIPVLNPSFQADNFPAGPGYRGGANPAVISGWNGGSGINGSDIGAGVAFADNGAIADGTRVAFIQGAGTLSQTLNGFTVGQTYWVQLWTNARNCCADQPQISISLGAQTLLAFQTLPPAGSNASYYLTNFVWTATAPSALLSIASRSAAGGDTAAVFDAVAVIARASNEVVVANPSFEASGQGIVAPGYYPNIAGWTKFGSDEIGINTSAGPFHDNGAVPDGSNVLVLKRASGVRQTIAGLVPGQSCRLSLKYNSRAATAAPTFRVSIDGLTAFDASVAAVGGTQPYKTLTFDFTALHETAELILESRTTGSDSALLVDAVSLSTIGASVLPSLALPSPGMPGGAGGIVTFNEIHYHPPAAGTPEWVELYNQNSVRVDMSGWRIKGGIAFTFPEGTVIESGAYRVVSSIANNPAGALGPFTGALNNAGDNCKLVTKQDWLIDEIKYGVADEWPVAPDGAGATLSKRAVYFASNTSASWSASPQLGGTPGTINFASPPSGPVVPTHVAGPVVINEIFYHAHPVYADPANGISFRENPAEWIELNNRSDQAVDLSGWTLDDAIHYTFPPNSILAPNGFVVVNQTEFSGTLANSGDSIKLRDPAGVLVDKVRYRDGGRWAEFADGGGASLELLDARADNTPPEAWAASDESTKTAWETVSYRALGAEAPGSNNPSLWHEFLLGFLDAGEALIDDLSVREDPSGANLELIQNGTFESDSIGQAPARWRCLGTHKQSVVIQDPAGPGKVLKVVATGPIEHTYNNCSTTLVGNRVINPAKTYEIRFRVKWLAGSPQFNTRLYLARAIRTTILTQPAAAGTPGAPNSRRVTNAGPTYDEFVHAPLVPALGQPVTVVVRAQDPDGIAGVTLFYSVNGATFQSTSMILDAAGRYSGSIPGQPFGGTVVQFYIQGIDSAGAKSLFPAAGAGSRALYRIGDGGVSAQPVANKMRLIMTASDAAFMHAPIHSVSDARFGATLIVNDREVYYGVGVRLRSSPYGRQGSRTGWNVTFDPEQPFRGTETGIVLDGAFNMPSGDGSGFIENTLGASINEMLFQRIAERAGALAAEHDDVVYLATPFYENRIAQLRMRRYNNTALDDFTPNGGNGTLFKQEIIYHPVATVDGNPESLKNPYSTFLAVDIASQGANKEAYRFNYLIQNQGARDDFSGIQAMCAAFSQPNASLYAASAAAIDLESWTRTMALNALTGLADTYNQGLAHNIQFLTRPGDNRVMLLPWDMDHAFYYATNSGIYGANTHRVRDLIADPRVKRRMAGHLYDLCNIAFNNTYLDPWIDHFNTVAGKSYNAKFKSWVSSRRAFVLNQLATDWPATPFKITTNNGAAFSINTPTATLQGNAWINVHSIRRAGATEPLALVWNNGQQWQVSVPLGAGANTVVLEALDNQGALVATSSILITNTGSVAPAGKASLVISELMYHPADPSASEQAAGFLDADDFEFIELLNASSGAIDLTGATFSEGITYTFLPGTVAPGARILLVKNAAAFSKRYNAVPVLGVYGGSLNNGGDHLLLLDRGGVAILDFSYGDTVPWPIEADGSGYSLTVINPALRPDPADPRHWRVSVAAGGSPGSHDALAPAGYPTLLNYALTALPAGSFADGNPVFTWSERIGADDAAIIPELSGDLKIWKTDSGDGSLISPASANVNPDGTRTIRVHAPPHSFFRLRLQPIPSQ